MVTSKSNRLKDEEFGAEFQEPASLITQTAFRTIENQARRIDCSVCSKAFIP
jgi:hypothetical protein